MEVSVYNMKRTTILFQSLVSIMACFSLLLNVSCSSEDAATDGNTTTSGEKGLFAEAQPMEYDITRSRLYFSSKGLEFAWTLDDELTIFAANNDEAKQEFKLRSGSGSTIAKFSSNDFELTEGKRYFALSKTQNTAGGATKIPDQNNITLDFSNQKQIGNASTEHLGEYDYMVASSICEERDNTHFSFSHISSSLRLVLVADDGLTNEQKNAFLDTEFKEIELYDSENRFRQPKRLFSFETGTTAEGYTPVWPADQDIKNTDPRFIMSLKKTEGSTDGVKPTDAHVDGTTTTNQLVAYMKLPPENFTGRTMGFIVRGKHNSDDVIYYGSYTGFEVKMGKAHQITIKLKPTTDFHVTLKINHDWQLGDTTDLTRSTGDPGYEDKIEVPTHLYYIFCVNGKVKNVTPLEGGTAAQAVNHIIVNGKSGTDSDIEKQTTDENDKWTTTTTDGKTISTYGKPLTFQLQSTETGDRHLYVVASRTPLDISGIIGYDNPANPSEVATATGETTVQALAYGIQGVASSPSVNAPLDDSQKFLRDLYSTPWDATNFPGDLTDPMQDVILYHVAAKVDLKWNTATPFTPETHKVKVISVNNTGLSLFNPTTAGGSGAGYTVSTDITPGTMVNGRQVFYLPQFNSYNATVGTFNGNVEFSPVTTNGYTSWLRWLKKVK